MSLALASLHFLRPHWLWALLALPLLWWSWRARQRRSSAWLLTRPVWLSAHIFSSR